MGCDQGLRGKADGQACLWWSQGCSIGCEKCATNAEGPFSPGPFSGKAPQAGKIGFRTRYCNATHNSGTSKTNPTPLINSTLPKEAWTLNIGAEEGSEEDSYRYNPWRAPGYAPVVDPCGQAGGEYKGQGIGGDSVFTTTPLSTMGDMGSKLPASKLRPRWVAGGCSRHGPWLLRDSDGRLFDANRQPGRGRLGPALQPRRRLLLRETPTQFLYPRSLADRSMRLCPRLQRLCKADKELTEECFQQTPLAFDKTKQTLVWSKLRSPLLHSLLKRFF